MILITGGAYQGKLEFAEKLYTEKRHETEKLCLETEIGSIPEKSVGKEHLQRETAVIIDGEQAIPEHLKQAHIITRFHLWIRALLKEEQNPYLIIEELLKENPDVMITLTQLGCGVVPIEKFDRNYREVVGRIGCMLAERAEEVYLVNCGIAQRLK